MKKAVLVGGSNGIGLALALQLADRDYQVSILDICEPQETRREFVYRRFDMLYPDFDVLAELAADPETELLMITAGIGRVASFENLHIAEIEKLMTINAVSTIQVMRAFYDRIRSEQRFYCGVMASIAGIVSSPLFSVYAASKAAVVRFVESVNIELEMAGTQNRILDVSPLSVKGTRFNGGSNQPEILRELTNGILDHLFASQTQFIPQYDELCRGIIARYQADPREYGLHSYRYKVDSGRLDDRKRVVIGYLSGTFDLFHVGHLNLLQRAKSQCDYLIVGVHSSGAWKGKETFIPFEDRMRMVAACRYVDKVVPSCPEDSDAWQLWKYHKLFVGSDYKGTERFRRYEEYFRDKDVQIVYFDYTQGVSSTDLRAKIQNKK